MAYKEDMIDSQTPPGSKIGIAVQEFPRSSIDRFGTGMQLAVWSFGIGFLDKLGDNQESFALS